MPKRAFFVENVTILPGTDIMICIWFSRHFLSGGHLETGGGSMGNRRYTLEQKIRFLDTYEKMGSVAGAARAVGILSREV